MSGHSIFFADCIHSATTSSISGAYNLIRSLTKSANVELAIGHPWHAPRRLTTTIGPSILTNSTSPPSATRAGRTSSSAASTRSSRVPVGQFTLTPTSHRVSAAAADLHASAALPAIRRPHRTDSTPPASHRSDDRADTQLRGLATKLDEKCGLLLPTRSSIRPPYPAVVV